MLVGHESAALLSPGGRKEKPSMVSEPTSYMQEGRLKKKPLIVDAYHELVMDDYKRFRQETKMKQEQHKRQQQETAAYLKKQMEAKRLEKQLWH